VTSYNLITRDTVEEKKKSWTCQNRTRTSSGDIGGEEEFGRSVVNWDEIQELLGMWRS